MSATLSTDSRSFAQRLYRAAPVRLQAPLKSAALRAQSLTLPFLTVVQRFVQTPVCLLARSGKRNRKLEIGPGPKRIKDFETLNIVGGLQVDYVCNAQKRLPFSSGTFETVYASHILEHIPWYRTEQVLAEWVRILAPGGRLEIWVPDGLEICKAFVAAEEHSSPDFQQDGWYRFNPQKDPCLWVSGRTFSYGDGTGKPGHPNWHLALFSPRYLEQLLRNAGCTRVERLDRSQVRGHDHGWINLGMVGIKA